MSGPPVPTARPPLSARAPGKCILFGEHAVVHGRPELLLAVDLYTQVLASPSTAMALDDDPAAPREHPYLRRALEDLWPPGAPPLDWRTVSQLPKAAGLGSSAAFCAAVVTALLAARGGAERSEVAERSFEVERGAQGVGSPGDTSASVAGGLVSVNGRSGALLWELTDGDQRWRVRRVPDPGWVWVVAYSGVPRNTAATVRAVSRRLAEPDGPGLLARFEEVALAGIEAILAEDRDGVGRRMSENQALLREVGVSSARLEELLDAVAPVATGAKLTGAGAGGSIVALPRPGREVEAMKRLRRVGAQAFVVRAAPFGASLVLPKAP